MHPTSRGCREFLQAVLQHGHRMAMTEDIQAEWNKHQSRFARRWRSSMVARKRVDFVEVPPHLTLQKRVAQATADAFLAAIIDKDRRLIEAALVTEKRVTSLDDHVREHLQKHINRLPEVRLICWVNPCAPEEKALHWLQAGAPAERTRLLGSLSSRPPG